MLHLATATSPAWVAHVTTDLDELLVDLAHCEKKAASTIVSLLFRYPERSDLAIALSPLAREELLHFEQVLAHLATRGVSFHHQVPAPYAKALFAAVRPSEPDRLIDTLLCLALIEARSCERMRLLADSIADPSTAALYRQLLDSEARHHALYVTLAGRAGAGEPRVLTRLQELACHEATLLAAAPTIVRMHS